jgi:lipopolysaccharide/colanic/teichoic acid biosynthesis glycosyltransferase
MWMYKRNRSSVDGRQTDKDFGAMRMIDTAGAAVLVLFLAPLLILTSALLMLTNTGSVFVAEPRLGRGGRNFLSWRFRVHRADAGWKDEPELTLIGALLRRSGIEELPQLFNILLGQVGLFPAARRAFDPSR